MLVQQKLLDYAMCRKVTTEFFTLRRAKQYSVWRVPNSAAFYNPTTGVRILNNVGLVNTLSNAVGVELLPSYCYGRLYTKGDELKQHTDRKASEYAVSITVGKSSNEEWPIYVEHNENHKFSNEIGECLIYKGHSMPHWRDELKFDWYASLLLFYVDKNGKFKDLAHERRYHNFSTVG